MVKILLLIANDLVELSAVAVDVFDHVVIAEPLGFDKNKIRFIFKVLGCVEHIDKRINRDGLAPKSLLEKDPVAQVGGIVVKNGLARTHLVLLVQLFKSFSLHRLIEVVLAS